MRDQATGKPIAGVTVSIRPGNSTVRSGPDGQFEILDHRQEVGYGLIAQPESDQGYFTGQACAREQAAAPALTQDLLLLRGIALSGHVTNNSTGKPPKKAIVEYYPLPSNQHNRGISCVNMIPASTATVRPDGSYSLPVLPGPGVIGVVASPREDFAAANVMNKEWAYFMGQQRALLPRFSAADLHGHIAIALAPGQAGALSIIKYHALALINPPVEAPSQKLDLSLQSAQTLQGKVLGPDGQPLSGAQVVGLTALRDDRELLEGASFTVTGLNPQVSRELFFQHRDKKLGKVVTVRGDAAQPVTVKLEPWGAATGRLVDELGVPIPHAHVILSEDACPGFAMAQTDTLGRFRIELVPGQKYSWGSLHPLLKELGTVQVGAGQVQDLGDLAQKTQVPRPKIPQPTSGAPR